MDLSELIRLLGLPQSTLRLLPAGLFSYNKNCPLTFPFRALLRSWTYYFRLSSNWPANSKTFDFKYVVDEHCFNLKVTRSGSLCLKQVIVSIGEKESFLPGQYTPLHTILLHYTPLHTILDINVSNAISVGNYQINDIFFNSIVNAWFRLFVKSHFESLFLLLLCFSFVYFHFKYVWKQHWIFRLQYSVCNQRARHWSQNHWLEFRPWTKYEWML